jgi:hypothetical protein
LFYQICCRQDLRELDRFHGSFLAFLSNFSALYAMLQACRPRLSKNCRYVLTGHSNRISFHNSSAATIWQAAAPHKFQIRANYFLSNRVSDSRKLEAAAHNNLTNIADISSSLTGQKVRPAPTSSQERLH